MSAQGVLVCLGALLVLGSSCGEALPRHRIVTGSSGREWKVLAQKPLTTRQGEKAMQFRYVTDLDLAEVEALRAEIELFLADRESMLADESLEVVIVSANTPIKSGWAETRDEYRVRFGRTTGAGWSITREGRFNDTSRASKVHVH